MESEEYITMRLSEQAAMKDEHATRLVAEYSEKREDVERILADANMDHGALAQAGETLQEAEYAIDNNELLKKMRDSREAFSDMMKKVNAIIKYVVTGEEEEEEAHGCSGSCEGCGGGCGHHH